MLEKKRSNVFFNLEEDMFRTHVKTANTDVSNQFENIVSFNSSVEASHYINCHSIKYKPIRKFTLFNLKPENPRKRDYMITHQWLFKMLRKETNNETM